MTPAEPADRGRIPDLPRIAGDSDAWNATGVTNGIDVPSDRATPTWLRVPMFPVWATNILLSIPGVIAMLGVHEWPAREKCPACSGHRFLARRECPHCGATPPPPRQDGREIFEPCDSLQLSI